jgi:hypothetical protein
MEELTRSEKIGRPSRLQAFLGNLPENVVINLIANCISGLVPGLFGGVLMYFALCEWAPIALVVASFGFGSICATIMTHLRRNARSNVDNWVWTPGNSFIITFESADITPDGKKICVRLRCTNVSPLIWTLRTGRIEHFQVGFSPLSTRPLNVSGVLPGAVAFEHMDSKIVDFTGECPELDESSRYCPVFFGSSGSAFGLKQKQAGYIEFSRGYADDPAVRIGYLLGTATRLQ